MARRRTLWITISLLGLVILGTLAVLSSTSYYLAINDNAYLDPLDFAPRPPYDAAPPPPPAGSSGRPTRPQYNASAPERIPRIIHQTWKTETLPDRWKGLSKGCRDMHPD
jgi:hypothetical protein